MNRQGEQGCERMTPCPYVSGVSECRSAFRFSLSFGLNHLHP
jgi:hypothetical protein